MTQTRSSPSHTLRRFLLQLAGIFVLLVLLWTGWVYHEIATVAKTDFAQSSDAIAVFGAAEYSGRPSPVLHARLDHVVTLYRKQIAPIVITLGGGSDKDSGNTEGGVSRDYLLANGIPYDRIIAETTSTDTEQQVQRLVEIARENNLHHMVVVSDGTHLFRIRALCEDENLDVYTSPRPPLGRISDYDLAQRYLHEILSYTFWKLHLNVDGLQRWLEDKPE